ncbi:MAG: hypothetical protein ACK49F_12545 [Bacteroidota bacterium]
MEVRAICRGYFSPFFSPMCYTSARGLAMKAPFINNLSNQTGDVMVNPVNPDSKRQFTGTIWKLTLPHTK